MKNLKNNYIFTITFFLFFSILSYYLLCYSVTYCDSGSISSTPPVIDRFDIEEEQSPHDFNGSISPNCYTFLIPYKNAVRCRLS